MYPKMASPKDNETTLPEANPNLFLANVLYSYAHNLYGMLLSLSPKALMSQALIQ